MAYKVGPSNVTLSPEDIKVYIKGKWQDGQSGGELGGQGQKFEKSNALT